MGLFGPLALYDLHHRSTARVNAIRFIQRDMAPGGNARLLNRARNILEVRDSILYFLLFDPDAPSLRDPRPDLPLDHLADGIGRYSARTGWHPDASWFTYRIGWNKIDHQMGDGNMFELYRKGEWLTKERTGYGTGSGTSDYKNTLTIENDESIRQDFRHLLWRRHSQYSLSTAGDGKLLARSTGQWFVYLLGDATDLYNSPNAQSMDVAHASRSIVWLQPDHVITYDRARTHKSNRAKRFWLNFASPPEIEGRVARAVTPKGQQVFVTSLLPGEVELTAQPGNDPENYPAQADPMQHRLRVEALGGPAETRFLHVLQGADADVARDPVGLVRSDTGPSFEGVVVDDNVVLFPEHLNQDFATMTYVVPSGVRGHLLTGLAPNGSFGFTTTQVPEGVRVTVSAGGPLAADSGGVLVIGQIGRQPPAGNGPEPGDPVDPGGPGEPGPDTVTRTYQTGSGSYDSTKDVTINNQNAQWNQGHGLTDLTGSLRLGAGAAGYDSRGLLRFDDLDIPAAAEVVSASLTVTFLDWTGGNSVTGYYLTQAWNPTTEQTVTWLRRDADLHWSEPGASAEPHDRLAAPTFHVAHLSGSGAQERTVELAPEIVQRWVSEPGQNHGVLLVVDGSDRVTRIYASEHATVSQRPRLTIRYRVPSPPPQR